jgi:hypothetical protein
MRENTRAKATVQVVRGIEEWARASQLTLPPHFSIDLAEVGRTAAAIQEAIDQLLSKPPLRGREAGKALVALQGWIYDELPDHTDRLKAALEQVAESVYSQEDSDTA